MASSKELLSSDSTAKRIRSLKRSGEESYGQNQSSTLGSIRRQTSNVYELPSHYYEHIIEGQSKYGTPTFPILNHHNISGDEHSFKRKCNPLFMKFSDEEQPRTHSRLRVFCKYGVLVLLIFNLIAFAVILTCWIYESSSGNELEKLRRTLSNVSSEMDLLRNSTSQNGEDIRSLKDQTLDFKSCQYKTKERGSSNQMEFTLTDFIPELKYVKSGVVTGVHCVVEGGTTAVLRFSGTQYTCNCTGKTDGDSRFCKIHYWFCPKLIQD